MLSKHKVSFKIIFVENVPLVYQYKTIYYTVFRMALSALKAKD